MPDSSRRDGAPRPGGVRLGALVTVVAVGLSLAACGGAPTSAGSTTTQAPLPAGPTPSPIATMVCTRQAAKGIDSALGETAAVTTPTWSATDHLYACRFGYPTGSFRLSVKELSSWAATKDYVAGLEATMGKTRDLGGLGQAAFQSPDGSVVVRKDWKVLTVDPTGLPAQFGVPPTASEAVAVTVADVILGCWNGD